MDSEGVGGKDGAGQSRPQGQLDEPQIVAKRASIL